MTAFLDPYRDAELSLSQLTEAARSLLSRAGAGSSDDRVATFPDARTVRYYQTLGVTDRPTRYQGRQAVYGYRHLLQVVAVKLLQARGLSLAQVQDALRGVQNAQLEAAAAQALGGPAAPDIPDPPQARTSRALIAAAIAPGVTVTLDPDLITDPQAVLALLTHALSELASPEST